MSGVSEPSTLIKGIANTLADDISRWEHNAIGPNLRALRLDIYLLAGEASQSGGAGHPLRGWTQADRTISYVGVFTKLRGRFMILVQVLRG